jgi:glutathione peroxidase-family protein
LSLVDGAPANLQFKAQEPGTDDEVLQFCQLNYGVTFPIAKKVRRSNLFGHEKILTGRETSMDLTPNLSGSI